jgi:hypothetical protein
VFVSSTHLETKDRFLLLSNSCGFINMGRHLWREDGSVVYSCCWSSPAQSFSGPSPSGLMITFYCLRFETLPTWWARSPHLYSPGTGWPSYTPDIGFLFRRLLRLAGLRWRYSTPPPYERLSLHKLGTERTEKHSFQQLFYCCLRIRCRGQIFIDPLKSKWLLLLAYISRYVLD